MLKKKYFPVTHHTKNQIEWTRDNDRHDCETKGWDVVVDGVIMFYIAQVLLGEQNSTMLDDFCAARGF